MVGAVVADTSLVSSLPQRRVCPACAERATRELCESIVDPVESIRTTLLESRPPETAPIRDEFVARVRAEIAAETYLTDDKLDLALTRMLPALETQE